MRRKMPGQDGLPRQMFKERKAQRRGQTGKKRAAGHFAERRQQGRQPLRRGTQIATCLRLPGVVGQRLPGSGTGRAGERPGTKRFAQGFELVPRTKDETDARTGQAEKLAQRAQDDQIRRLRAAGQSGQTLLGFGVGKRFIDNQPATPPLQSFSRVEQVAGRQNRPVGLFGLQSTMIGVAAASARANGACGKRRSLWPARSQAWVCSS
jgi:hypothetical protein